MTIQPLPRRMPLVVLLGAIGFLMAVTPSRSAPACTITWDGGAATTSWHDDLNWSTNAEPGAADNVCISSPSTVEHSDFVTTTIASLGGTGKVTVSGGALQVTAATDAEIDDLELSGGTLAGTGTLTVADELSWTGGQMAGSGTTLIAADAELTIDPGEFGGVTFDGTRTLQNQGQVIWTSGQIYAYGATQIDNSGTFDARADNSLVGVDADASLHNTGTLTKSAGTGQTFIDYPLDNDGTISASAGELVLSEGDDDATQIGSFGASAPARLKLDVSFGEAFKLGTGADFTGRTTFASGTVEANAAVPLNGQANELSGGTLAGTGTLTVADELSWTGGQMAGSGTTLIAADAELTIDSGEFGSVSFSDTRKLQNQGQVIWTSGQIYANGATQIDNSGTFDARVDNYLYGFDPDASFHNTGTLTKSAGTGQTFIDYPLDNDGTVSASAGELVLNEGDVDATQTGSFGASAPGRVKLDAQFGEAFKLGTGADFTGRTTFASGTVEANAAVPLNGQANELSGGTLAGTGTLTVADELSWTGGQMAGSGTTLIPAAGELTIDSGEFGSVSFSDTRKLQNQGQVIWTSGQIYANGATQIDNSGTFDARVDNYLYGFDPDASFHNTGTLTKSAGTGQTFIDYPLDNDGTVSASAGELVLNEGDVDATQTGSFGASAPGRVKLDAQFGEAFKLGTGADFTGRTTFASGTVEANAAVPLNGQANELSGGTLAGTGTLTVADELSWTGGQMGGSGTTLIAAAGELTIDSGEFGGVSLEDTRILRIEGQASWPDGSISLGDDALIDNEGLFEANSESGSMFGFSNGRFHNGGTLTKTAGADTTVMSVDLDNDGVFDPRVGSIEVGGFFDDGFSQTADGRHRVELTGATPGVGFGVLDITGVAKLNGTLQIVTAPGFVPGPGTELKVITYFDRNGDFLDITGEQINASLAWDVRYDPDGVTLVAETIAPPPVPSPRLELESRKLIATGRRVPLELSCEATTPCRVAATLTSARRIDLGARKKVLKLASGRIDLTPGQSEPALVRLRPRASRYLDDRGSLAVRIETRVTDDAGNHRRQAFRAGLRAGP